MPAYTIHFGFTQKFPFPAAKAYEWCTDYNEGDIALEGMKGTRRIEWTDDSTVVLTDSVGAGAKKVTKVKVVRLYPKLLFWTNTRMSEPGKYSQFIYQLVPRGEERLAPGVQWGPDRGRKEGTLEVGDGRHHEETQRGRLAGVGQSRRGDEERPRRKERHVTWLRNLPTLSSSRTALSPCPRRPTCRW